MHTPPRLGEALQPRGHVDPGPEESPVLCPDLAQVNADPELHPAVLGQQLVAPAERVLHLHRAVHGPHSARELGQEVVPGEVDQPPPLLAELKLHLSAVGRHGADGGGFVLRHQARVADHVGREDRGEPALKRVG